MTSKMAVMVFYDSGASKIVDIVRKIEEREAIQDRISPYYQPRTGKRKAQWKKETSTFGRYK